MFCIYETANEFSSPNIQHFVDTYTILVLSKTYPSETVTQASGKTAASGDNRGDDGMGDENRDEDVVCRVGNDGVRGARFLAAFMRTFSVDGMVIY